ncbi:hypothetical protein BZZ01_23980 [Nostocales cyanobacterium HT-58-2]|nr:hypothetical protein BZZ01_23980 [Nostocales cyanobacterium HT-58-2]
MTNKQRKFQHTQKHLVQNLTSNLFDIIGQQDSNRKVVATSEIKKGKIIYDIEPYSHTQSQNFLSVQISSEEHILDTLLEAMNHSCSPTTFVDCNQMLVIAEQDILPGEELTFFYPSTEWKMDRPFSCHCGSLNCLGFVSGAKDLSISQLLKCQINTHIKTLIQNSFKSDYVKSRFKKQYVSR